MDPAPPTPHPDAPTPDRDARRLDVDVAVDEALLGDDRLTAMGLLIETFTGIIERVERDMEQLGLGMSSFEVMIRLARSPDHRLRMTELAAQSTLTNSGLTRVVDRLSRAGYVERVPCATDRRGWFAALTEQGLAKIGSILPAHLETVERSFTGILPADQLDQLLGSLRTLRTVVRPASDPLVAATVAED